ncbi:hypothetical protein [Streptomyces buecherae]|uniref:Uncharacterized protein n=1 Tax=Streptomyces buecherae TaxID=2763006 RepID=A0A7H8NCX8_9ACTN|nr:hypothetical protein [Streptomyces buecherae]QKW52311.1 hypothetical protein HUT08_25350 [Streptomyces buecherae]
MSELSVADGSSVHLPAPEVDDVVDGALAATDAPYGATVRVAPYAGMAKGDVITVTFGDLYTDVSPVSTSWVGREMAFVVPTEVLAAAKTAVAVAYSVERSGGGSLGSETTTITVVPRRVEGD